MKGFANLLRASTALVFLSSAFVSATVHADARNVSSAASSCRLDNGIKHIVHLQFDNVHLRRDNPNVPSDLEQMPNLLNFIEDHGTMLTNHHTPLISHTADDIITTLTGVYGEKHGQPVANSYGFFRPDGSIGFSSSFVYWTDIAPDGQPQMIDQRGKVHPAPWAVFTRAGCDVGAFSTANIEFENVSSDINNVFGPNSPQAAEAKNNFDKAVADFEGIAIHCAQNSKLCSQGAAPDVLADEPGGYAGFTALYGNVAVAPQINQGKGVVDDLDGNPIADSNGNPGFPGFDPTASQTLGYVATMLEAGVPVVYAYIADAHDNHFTFSGSYGPGEAGYVQQLASYNAAFGKFFARLAAEGITRDNTLFIVTADENDHFAGQAGAPAGCDGIHVACTYIRLPLGCDGDSVPCTTTNLGEVDVDMRSLLLTEATTFTVPTFSVHSDDAPTVYLAGNPGPADPVTRAFEQNSASLVAFDPIVGTNVPLMKAMGDPAEMALLHMVTKDPARTPTFVYFGNDDFFITAGSKSPACTSIAACSDEQPGFNWNHGDIQQDITRTWLGMVGPGVRRMGRTGEVFTDHTDIRPTLVSLAGLTDDYSHDGRVIFEVLDNGALPHSLRDHDETLSALAAAYKAINAPLGELGRGSLRIATHALTSDAATIDALDGRINDLTAQRNAIASKMIAMLEAAEFQNKPIDRDDAKALIDRARDLLESLQ
ncbi:MAG TPA: hypothetical protein VHS76_01780 [Steroidobacteraceae bacterium]|nr:hypothetical protein [Steroidobacteraceae bacterium]